MKYFGLLFLLLISFSSSGQETKVPYIEFEITTSLSYLNEKYNSGLESIISAKNQRLSNLKLRPNNRYKTIKGDTLFELILIDSLGKVDYFYYNQNKLIINFEELNSTDYVITLFNQNEIDKKQWIFSDNQLHVTDFDNKGNMSNYLATWSPDINTKIEFEKKWKNSVFKTGQKRTWKNSNDGWELIKKEKVTKYEWPSANSAETKSRLLDNEIKLSESGIYTSIHIGTYKFLHENWLEKNTDSVIFTYGTYYDYGEYAQITTKTSFLPYKLKDGLETGTYRIYEKKYTNGKILIDAQILNGYLHGVYNEYDLESGKIKIYCSYKMGKLNGRKTTFYYNKKGKLVTKRTELWENGIFIKTVP